MAMMRHEPWSLLNQFSSELNRMFDHNMQGKNGNAAITARNWVPAVDVKEEAGMFVIHADIPGVEVSDIEINMEDGVLTISGERKMQNEEEYNGYKRIERAHGSFQRSFTLPDTADAENISAKYSNGVLEVSIPKQEKVQARKIQINA
jgi:HSP20 family protein